MSGFTIKSDAHSCFATVSASGRLGVDQVRLSPAVAATPTKELPISITPLGISTLHTLLIATTRLTLIALLLLVSATSDRYAQGQEVQSEAQSEAPFKTKIIVVDQDGAPVAGASVIVKPGFSFENTTYYPRDELLKVPVLTTNQSGVVSASVQRKLRLDVVREGMITTLSNFRIEVKHDDFLRYEGQREELKTNYKAVLKHGVQFAVDAVNGDGQKLSQDLYALTPYQQSADWKLHDNGLLVSPNFPRHPTPLRLVHVATDSPTLFSKEFVVDPGFEAKVLLRSVKLQPGVRVEGKLDPSVPRPVKNGLVTVHVLGAEMNPAADKDAGADNDQDDTEGKIKTKDGDEIRQILWNDYAEVNSDGTFVFESLPRNCVAQFFANCEGWTSRSSEPKKLEKLFSDNVEHLKFYRKVKNCLPNAVELGQKDQTISMEMNRTSPVKIRLIDFDGDPLKGIDVYYVVEHFLGNGVALNDLFQSTRKNLVTGTRALKGPIEVGHRFGAALKTDENGIISVNDYRIPVPTIFISSPTYGAIQCNGDVGDGVLELQVAFADTIASTIRISSHKDYWTPNGFSWDFDDFIKNHLDVERY